MQSLCGVSFIHRQAIWILNIHTSYVNLNVFRFNNLKFPFLHDTDFFNHWICTSVVIASHLERSGSSDWWNYSHLTQLQTCQNSQILCNVRSLGLYRWRRLFVPGQIDFISSRNEEQVGRDESSVHRKIDAVMEILRFNVHSNLMW